MVVNPASDAPGSPGCPLFRVKPRTTPPGKSQPRPRIADTTLFGPVVTPAPRRGHAESPEQVGEELMKRNAGLFVVPKAHAAEVEYLLSVEFIGAVIVDFARRALVTCGKMARGYLFTAASVDYRRVWQL